MGTKSTTPVMPPFILKAPPPAGAGLLAQGLRGGCWLVDYAPPGDEAIAYAGTLRLEKRGFGRIGSGDLYQRPQVKADNPPRLVAGPGPNPADGIPILPCDRYRYYLTVTSIDEDPAEADAELGFNLWRFSSPNAWTNEGVMTAKLTRVPPPRDFPSPMDYLEGDVRDAHGAIAARIKLGWVSDFFRRATLKIDAVKGCSPPKDNGDMFGWAELFQQMNWDVRPIPGETDVQEASGDSWTNAEMHAAMLKRRGDVNLDEEWRYHVLVVKRIDDTERGIMYDTGGTDCNKVPREGVGIATDWVFPADAKWGKAANKKFGDQSAPFFRTAVHELGHAFGLDHSNTGAVFMNTTDRIAEDGTTSHPFPTNIEWSHEPQDLKRLRHWPDIFIRPGGLPLGQSLASTSHVPPEDREMAADGLRLLVRPVREEAPLGAPVRVVLELHNTSVTPRRVPAKLSLKSEFVRGWVTGPAGAARGFSTMVLCADDQATRDLQQGDPLVGEMTLLRGSDGALFPGSGLHEIALEVRWPELGGHVVVRGGCTVLITGPHDPAHAAAAHEILRTPETHVVLVVGGENPELRRGLDAIQGGLNNPILAPHYRMIEARRLARLPEGPERRHDDILRLAGAAERVESVREWEKLDERLERCKAEGLRRALREARSR